MIPIKPPSLESLSPGQSARVASLPEGGSMRRRFQDLGLIEGTIVQCLYKSPLGDPSAYLIRGAVIALRKSDAGTVAVEPIPGVESAGSPIMEKAVRHGAV